MKTWIRCLLFAGCVFCSNNAMAQEVTQQGKATFAFNKLVSEPLTDLALWKDDLTLLGIELEPLHSKLAAQMQRDATGLLVLRAPEANDSNQNAIQPFDIILRVDKKLVSNGEDFKSEVIGHSGKDLDLVVVRAAKELPIRISVPSIIGSYVATSTQNSVDRRYRLGVMLSTIDEALRMHLNLEKDKGLVVTEVVRGGPAEKVGIETNDILLELESEAIKSEDHLREKLQEYKDREVSIKLIRRGKQIETKTRAQLADEPQNNSWIDVNVPNFVTRDFLFRSMNSVADDGLVWTFAPRNDAAPSSELAEIRDLLKKLNDKIDQLEKK